MRALGIVCFPFALSVTALGSLACVPQEIPGEVVGTYRFQGPLEESTCGPGLPVVDQIDFRVELRRDETMAIWRRPEAPIIYGVVDEDEEWRFEIQNAIPAYDRDPVSGRGPCVFEQIETIELTAHVPDGLPNEDDEDEDEVVYEGSSTVVIRPAAGYDCGPSLAVNGGPFNALPCSVEYTFDGVSIDPIY